MKAKIDLSRFSKRSFALALEMLDNDGTIIGEAQYIKRDAKHIYYSFQDKLVSLQHKTL